jgi:hypothetical protein
LRLRLGGVASKDKEAWTGKAEPYRREGGKAARAPSTVAKVLFV